jgi:GxxExxY protein
MYDEDVTDKLIKCAIEVHKILGPGLLESAYEECLGHELTLNGLSYEKQKMLPVMYKGKTLACAYRIDLRVSVVKGV